MIKLYNTLSRKLEVFKPISEKQVTLYTCGPTVYDYQHIGNFRKFVFDDTLRRTLAASGYNVNHVMNITDVGHLVSDADEGEDKLEKGAKREGKTVWEVSEHFTNAFKEDSKKLNILEPNGYHGKIDNYARATDFIDEQIALIKILLDKDFAYLTERAIYFDVSKLKDYGELSGQRLSEKEVGVREEVVTDSNKRYPQDFAVWFFLKGHYENHTMHWNSPWGEGFPGWHLECSAIIHKLLGDPIDIHTGGVDHIGVHHTNEIAQTEAAYGNKLANYWMHCEHMLVDGQKMSKSLGNFYTIADIETKKINPLALRLLYLQGHYKTQINFTWENLESAHNRLNSLYAMAVHRFQVNNKDQWSMGESEFDDLAGKIIAALQDDLNTPKALAELSNIETLVADLGVDPFIKDKFEDFLGTLDELFGLGIGAQKDIPSELKDLIEEREHARKNQDWKKADELRGKLREQGIELNDTSHGPIWYRN
jgi:cysteinyl-tRNA synthetase